MRLLIVEDSQFQRYVLEHQLKHMNIHAVSVEDGEKALELLDQDQAFDGALVDWNMPRLSGIDFIKAVRARPEFKHLKLLMVTVNNKMEDVTEAIAAGADDYLMKPLTRETLEGKLRLVGLAV